MPELSYSLLELLISFTVILVLTALLAPLLKTVKQRAQGAVCASNLRQLAMANMMYANEHRGYFCTPLSYLCTEPEFWGGSYVSNIVTSSTLIKKGYLGNTNEAMKVFMCPADKGARYHIVAMGPARFSYTRNDEIAGLWPAYGSNTMVNSDRIKYPSRTTFLMEENEQAPFNDASFGRANADWLADRHAGMGSMAFCDGHVELVEASSYNSLSPTARLNKYLFPP